jgi:Tol biopolymer transport system component
MCQVLRVLAVLCIGGLAAGVSPAFGAFPGGNGRIAFESERDGGDVDIWTMRPNGSDPINLTANSPAFDADAKWSADGRSIAFMSDRVTRTNTEADMEVFVMGAKGERPRRITHNSVYEQNPVWSPDGRRLALTRCTEYPVCDIWVINVDRPRERRLTTSPGLEFQPAWSPDGRTILFVSDRNATPDNDLNLDIFAMDPRGGDVRQITFELTHENYPEWSPDGRLIAFNSDRQGPGEVFEIYTMRPDGSRQMPLTFAALGQNAGLAAWSPDGRKIAFTSDRTAEPGTGEPEVWTMRADGTRQRNRTNNPTSFDGFPDWQPLGRHERAEEDDD